VARLPALAPARRVGARFACPPQRLDTEKKGFITADDLSTFCTALGKTMEVEFEEMIAACKPETEGRLTKAEFGKLFSAMFPDVGKKSRSKKGPGRR
tara:strand:- start:10 stop:300 length:291 start_codon:yes stop_codon:yes gene_type:complete